MRKKHIQLPSGETGPFFLLNSHDGVPDFMEHGRFMVPALFKVMEVTDKTDSPLMCMTPESIHRQKLFYRMVSVGLFSRRRTLLLYKRNESLPGFQGCWDLFSGAVLVGEAREDAALRLTTAKTGIEELALRERARRRPDDIMPVHLTLFTGTYGKGVDRTVAGSGFLEVDKDELDGLIRDIPELLTPSLLWAHSSGNLMPQKKRNHTNAVTTQETLTFPFENYPPPQFHRTAK